MKQVITKHPNTFSFSQDYPLVQFLASKCLLENFSESGIISVPVEILQEALITVSLEEETKKSLEEDIAEAVKEGEEYIDYYCY